MYPQNIAGISWRQIEQLFGEDIRDETVVRCCGVVLKIVKETNFMVFYISDSTATLEAILYERHQNLDKQDLPRLGESVIVQGEANRKTIGGRRGTQVLLKMRIDQHTIISPDQQIDTMIKIAQQRRKNYTKSSTQNQKKSASITFRKVFSQEEEVVIRELILSILLLILQANTDIQSYCFNVVMLKGHRICKEFIRQNSFNDQSMVTVLTTSIKHLLQFSIIEQKPKEPKEEQLYIIRRSTLQKLFLYADKLIYEKKQKGTNVEMLVEEMNAKLGIFSKQKYVMQWKFIQLILQKMIRENRIYKTSDKKVFPNYD